MPTFLLCSGGGQVPLRYQADHTHFNWISCLTHVAHPQQQRLPGRLYQVCRVTFFESKLGQDMEGGAGTAARYAIIQLAASDNALPDLQPTPPQ